MGVRFSANLGYLWRGLPVAERVRRAAAAGFDAVEFHDEPQAGALAPLQDALGETGLGVISLNTRNGGTAGCAALPGMADRARREIDAAAAAGAAIGAGGLHVLAGCGAGQRASHVAALRHALDVWPGVVLIEPISAAGIPGYWLNAFPQAAEIMDELAHPRLRLLFDTFHVAAMGRDPWQTFRANAGRIAHIQIACHPERAEPDTGAPDHAALLPAILRAGYAGAFGAEYRPRTTEEAGLGWLATLRRAVTTTG